jgi:hypothetical protein
MRLACRQSPNKLFSTRWTPSNEICSLADKVPSRVVLELPMTHPSQYR